MKSTGITRRLDDLGRIVIPRELRRSMGLGENAPMEIYTDADKIILAPYRPGCLFCGQAEDVREIHGIKICRKCAESMPAVFGEEEEES